MGVLTAMCKEKATGLRLRVKAEVTPTGDDPSDAGEITDVSNLAVPPTCREEGERERESTEPW